ncbi:FG-GAP-like repeat-containing protein [Winogradskyella tangerina]|uniref:FG-GAP-like repeat-containing protein n=1 Tax=Winogradskyella tangerina TaxID=2023240 RepID=UPI000DBE98E0|nr:FG-GAP-like repeat-containing protein [Winogradskyella tangerina]
MRKLILLILSASFFGMHAQITFLDDASGIGINVVCGNTFLGNGITFFDYDNDGWDDLTICSAQGDPVHFLKNINGTFVVHNLSLPDNNKQTKQANWVDIDNDGDNDLFLTSDNSSVKLYENLGNMIMEDITNSSGMLTDPFPTYGASWGDYNNDGYLDVFLSIRDLTIPNILYKNNGDNTFTLVNNEAGLLTTAFTSFCSAFLDYDKDGDQDIYVSNDKPTTPNLMYQNNGDGTFTEVGALTGTNLYIDAMSVTVDDINHDGWLDIYVTNDDNDSALLINNQDGTFSDMAAQYQVTFNSLGWGAVFLDADNDADMDLYVSGETNGSFPQYLSSAFYENNSNVQFILDNTVIPNDFAESYSNAIGDIDNDGYPEIAVNHINNYNISLWENGTSRNNNWLKVKLEGTTSNRNGIGSLIEISINDDKQYRYTLCGEGYLSQNSGTEMFGVGGNTIIDYVKVTWLSGIEDVLYDVSTNQLLNIVEGSTLSIDENDALNFSHYPNPVKDKLNLRSQQIIEDVTVYNIVGQEVLTIAPKQSNVLMDLSSLNNGAYFIKLRGANTTRTIKVLKE